MGLAHAVQKGKMKAPSKQVADIAKSMKPKDVKKFAKTKEKNLPYHVKKEEKEMKLKEKCSKSRKKIKELKHIYHNNKLLEASKEALRNIINEEVREYNKIVKMINESKTSS